jgi:hypothetical protein
MLLVKSRPGATPEEFDAESMATRDAEDGRSWGATRHIVSRSLPESYAGEEPPAYDAVRELFVENLDRRRSAPSRAPEAWDVLTRSAAVEHGNSVLYVAHQRLYR